MWSHCRVLITNHNSIIAGAFDTSVHVKGYSLPALDISGYCGSGAVRLRRGYQHEALPTDKPLDISHLVFVVHGIGQRMYAGSVLKCCAE